MTRKLAIVFVSGLLFAVVLLSGAWVVGGQEMLSRIEKDGRIAIILDDKHDKGPQTTRSFELVGVGKLTVSVPVTLKFVKGEKAEMVVRGPEKMVKDLIWSNGTLSAGSVVSRGHLRIDITAPVMPNLAVRGAGDVVLDGLDQPALGIESSGAIDLKGTGKVGKLTIDAKGASDLDLSEVEAVDANVRIAGAGDIDIAATGKVDAAISGAGSIALHRKPAELTQRIKGAGSIEERY